jgi:hypothetical protein
MRGRQRKGPQSGAGVSQSQTPKGVRERDVGAAAIRGDPPLTEFLRRVPGTPTVGDGALFAEAQPLKVLVITKAPAFSRARWARIGEKLLPSSFRGTTRGVRDARRRGLLQAGIASTSLRFGVATHVAYRLIPVRSGTPRARSRRATRRKTSARRERELRESDDREIGRRREPQRAWLLARAVMKPEARASGAAKATDGARERGQGRQPRAEKDRELKKKGVPVRQKRTAEVGGLGLGSHRNVTLMFAFGWRAGRGQGLASWEHLAHTKHGARAHRGEKRPSERARGVTSRAPEFRDESVREGGLLPQGRRRSNQLQRKASPGQRSRRCVTARRPKWPRWFKPAFVRLQGRRARRGTATEASEAKIVTIPANEQFAGGSSGPAKAGSSA